jgi:IS5 family transposase
LAVLRRFANIDLGRAPAPDETTILNFRHLLEEHDLGGQMLDAVNHYLESRGIRISTGTIVDATIIHAPSSTKNEKKERDPKVLMRMLSSTGNPQAKNLFEIVAYLQKLEGTVLEVVERAAA